MSAMFRWVDHTNETMKSVYGYTNESVIKDEQDIYYNKDQFMSGEINLCFITGFSGSGKSTMGNSMEKYKVEHYDLDDVLQMYEFSNENLKEYGDLIYSFFIKGPGRPYRYYSFEDLQNCVNPDDKSGDNFDSVVINTFIDYAISYAKSHPKQKFVLEGIWIYLFVAPYKLKDYAVYIKGTSIVKSAWRSSIRDAKNDKLKGTKFVRTVYSSITDKIKSGIKMHAKDYNRFRAYYQRLSHEEKK